MRACQSTATTVMVGVVAVGLLTAPASAAPGTASSLTWTPCESVALSDFECATMDVPRDWSDASRGVFTLAVARHRSTGTAQERIGSIFFNPGGPGGSGLEALPTTWALLPAAVKRRFDLVTWDPRGIGSTVPSIDCEFPTWPLPPATGSVGWDAFAAEVRTIAADANAACLDRYRDVAPYVGTNNVVRDLDALRNAVGDPKLTYWAMSYGTRIGYVYALNYPERIRAILLDGPVSPRSSLHDFTYGYSTAADPALGILFERFPESKAHYRQSLNALEQAPLRLSPTRTYTRWDLGMAMEANASSQTNMPNLAQYLARVDRALSGTDAQRRKAKRYLRSIPPLPTNIAMSGISSFVQCLDYPDRITGADADRLGSSIRFHAPITGWLRAQQIPPACTGLDALEPDPVPLATGNNWTARMLMLAATRDSQTPYTWATQMANAFRSSVLVSYVGNQHVSYGAARSPCVNGAATRYLIHRVLPSVDLACDNMPPG